MPEAFEACREAGGKIRTISGPSKRYGLKANQYVRVCVTAAGKVIRGETHTKKNPKPGQTPAPIASAK